MKRVRIVTLLFIAALMLLCLVGCGSKQEGNYTVYYLDKDKSMLVPVSYKVTSDKVDDIIDELLDALSTNTDSADYFKPIPGDITVKDCKLNEGNLIIDFSADYYRLKGTEEVLTRSAIAKTMLQVEGVNKVTFYVSNKPLTDDDNNVVPSMSNDSFIDDYSDSSNFVSKKELSLYYATEDGQNLICEKKQVDVDERALIEEVVIDNLRRKPSANGAKVAIPEDTKILYTAVADGVCYITLDSSQLNEKSDVSDKAVIYSIVNSMCDSADVTSVVIKTTNANAKTQQNNLDISGTYVEDQSLVVQVVSDENK